MPRYTEAYMFTCRGIHMRLGTEQTSETKKPPIIIKFKVNWVVVWGNCLFLQPFWMMVSLHWKILGAVT